MRSNSNLRTDRTNGSSLPAEQENALAAFAATADDDALFDAFQLDAPISASTTNVRHGYLPLGDGPLVTADSATFALTVGPVRIGRSSTSNSLPRASLSATLATPTQIVGPSLPSAGQWRLDILYVCLTTINGSNPAAGTRVDLLWDSSGASAAFGSAPTLPTLKTHTSTITYVPIKVVRMVAGAPYLSYLDLLDPALGDANALGNLLARARHGRRFRRAYSPTNQSIAALLPSGGSAYAVGISDSDNGVMTPRLDASCEEIEILIPPELFSVVDGSAKTTEIDTSVDWRGRYFKASITTFRPSISFGFGEDPANAANLPTAVETGVTSVEWLSSGQSFTDSTPIGTSAPSKRWAAYIDGSGVGRATAYAASDAGTPFIDTGSYCGLYVDDATGALMFQHCPVSHTVNATAWILLRATTPQRAVY